MKAVVTLRHGDYPKVTGCPKVGLDSFLTGHVNRGPSLFCWITPYTPPKN